MVDCYNKLLFVMKKIYTDQDNVMENANRELFS
jgi:hypothetical protein